MTVNLVRRKKTPPPTFKGHYAGFITRLVAFVIDLLIVAVSIMVMLGTVKLILDFFSFNVESISSSSSTLGILTNNVILFLTSFAFTFVVNLIYCIFFWMVAGKTIGKAIMGLRVIGPKGSRMTIGRALRRYGGYWVSAIPLFLGYFWVLVNDHRHGWHDTIAGTSVIYDHDAQYTEAGVGRLALYAPKVEAKMEKDTATSDDSLAALPSGQQDEPKEQVEA